MCPEAISPENWGEVELEFGGEKAEYIRRGVEGDSRLDSAMTEMFQKMISGIKDPETRARIGKIALTVGVIVGGGAVARNYTPEITHAARTVAENISDRFEDVRTAEDQEAVARIRLYSTLETKKAEPGHGIEQFVDTTGWEEYTESQVEQAIREINPMVNFDDLLPYEEVKVPIKDLNAGK